VKLNRDKLNNCSLTDGAVASLTVIDRLQKFKPEEQVVGLAATFLLVCEHYRVSVQDVMTVTKNMIHDARRRHVPEFDAVDLYVRNELA